jgi:hypothetical protein
MSAQPLLPCLASLIDNFVFCSFIDSRRKSPRMSCSNGSDNPSRTWSLPRAHSQKSSQPSLVKLKLKILPSINQGKSPTHGLDMKISGFFSLARSEDMLFVWRHYPDLCTITDSLPMKISIQRPERQRNHSGSLLPSRPQLFWTRHQLLLLPLRISPRDCLRPHLA